MEHVHTAALPVGLCYLQVYRRSEAFVATAPLRERILTARSALSVSLGLGPTYMRISSAGAWILQRRFSFGSSAGGRVEALQWHDWGISSIQRNEDPPLGE